MSHLFSLFITGWTAGLLSAQFWHSTTSPREQILLVVIVACLLLYGLCVACEMLQGATFVRERGAWSDVPRTTTQTAREE